MRSLSKEKYVIAALITLGIFLLGFLLGLLIEQKRIQYIQNQGQIQKVNFDSLQLQYLFVDQLSKENNCLAISKTFDENVKTLSKAQSRLETFDDDQKISRQEFDYLKQEYILAEIRYWLLAKRSKQSCERDVVSLLYFYSTDKECPDCEKQAFILNYLKSLFQEKLLIFALDANFHNEPLIGILKNTYNVSVYPTLVIEDQKFERISETESLLSFICGSFKEKPQQCVVFMNTTFGTQ